MNPSIPDEKSIESQTRRDQTQRPEGHRVQAQQVQAKRVHAGPGSAVGGVPIDSLEVDLLAARTLATLLDSSFQIGGIKFGLDAVIGLVPVVGDFVALGIGMYPVMLARKHRLGKWVIARMMANLGADFLLGAVPIVGDAADVVFKAHLKNFKLLEEAAARSRSR